MNPTFSGLPDFNNDVLLDDDHAISPNSNQYPDLLNEYKLNLSLPEP